MRNPLTLHRIQEMHAADDSIAMLTYYDATFPSILDAAGIDCLLVGDSLGEVLQGQPSTLPVTLEHLVYHTQCVARRNRTAWVIGDLPFGSYQESKDQALHSVTALMEAGALKVKLEGGDWTTETVCFLVERGIPVCAHLGLVPRSVHALDGCCIQGRTETAAVILKQHARELVLTGAAMLELVPAALAREVTAALPIPVIGIGAGVSCSGQVLGLHDMLNIAAAKLLRFLRNFMDGSASVQAAAQRYVEDVKVVRFPSDVLNSY